MKTTDELELLAKATQATEDNWERMTTPLGEKVLLSKYNQVCVYAFRDKEIADYIAAASPKAILALITELKQLKKLPEGSL